MLTYVSPKCTCKGKPYLEVKIDYEDYNRGYFECNFCDIKIIKKPKLN